MTVFAKIGDTLQQKGGKCPDGWVEMPCERGQNQKIAAYVNGSDGSDGYEWVDKTLSNEEISNIRSNLYADIKNGSDKHYIEAYRKSLNGDAAGAEEAKNLGDLRVLEINSENPFNNTETIVELQEVPE
jgi:hypothetical protein